MSLDHHFCQLHIQRIIGVVATSSGKMIVNEVSSWFNL
jgi:hypothetical protein